jgi:hypothetical protein
MTLDQLREAVAGLSWTYAKTMPDIPHWYIVRGRTCPEDLYVALFQAVEAHGEYALFQPPDPDRKPYRQKYLELGDGLKYWVMTGSMGASRVLNRARIGLRAPRSVGG